MNGCPISVLFVRISGIMSLSVEDYTLERKQQPVRNK